MHHSGSFRRFPEHIIDKMEHDEKVELLNLLNQEVRINERQELVTNAIRIYCRSVIEALSEKDISIIQFYQNEL